MRSGCCQRHTIFVARARSKSFEQMFTDMFRAIPVSHEHEEENYGTSSTATKPRSALVWPSGQTGAPRFDPPVSEPRQDYGKHRASTSRYAGAICYESSFTKALLQTYKWQILPTRCISQSLKALKPVRQLKHTSCRPHIGENHVVADPLNEIAEPFPLPNT